MYFFKIEEFLWQYRRFISLLIVVFVVQFFELVLLHYKYNIFIGGGFLQPIAYESISERIQFILISIWYDFILFGFCSSLWFYFADRLDKHGVHLYYIFISFSLLIMGGWLGLKFKVLSYFNDTLNFLILTNLGGGSLKDAFAYGRSEITLIAGCSSLVILFFFISYKMLKKVNYPRSFHKNKQKIGWYKIIILGGVLTPLMTLFVTGDKHLRYGMRKKTSFYLVSHALNSLSDFDFDGFGYFSFPTDQDAFNKHIYPGALDIPNNGIDEDGFLGDAIMPQTDKDAFLKIHPKKGKHIVIIVLESTRADALEVMVNDKYVAPVLRKIAKEGTIIDYAYSHTGYTVTSLEAIFNRNIIGRKSHNLLGFLGKSGYQMSILSGQDESFGHVATKTGMRAEGNYFFDARVAIDDRVYASKEPSSLRLSEERIVEQFKERVSQLDFNQPQFIYLNFQAAHFPYSHPNMKKLITEKFIARSDISMDHKEQVAETYWNAVANADWAVGEVVNELIKLNTYQNTVLVILGDHGESLFDDGFLGHGHSVNNIQTKIPLIINDTNIKVDQSIGQVDVAEMAVRSALSLDNNWLDHEKPVFQMVGDLQDAALIAHVSSGGERTTFDFRSEQVFFSDTKQWEPYQKALDDPIYGKRVVDLIREWEDLRWQAHLIREGQD